MITPMVAIDNLVVDYATNRHTVRALDNFSMHVRRGELVAMVGPSGSGKTTMLSILSGMVGSTAGTVMVDGTDVLALRGKHLDRYRRQTVGIVFQGFNLIPSLNARENVAAPLLVAGRNRRKSLARADELLAEVGLDHRGHHRPFELSGGEQQRVAVARGLVGDPMVLLADEPTANLDPVSAKSVVDLLLRLRTLGRTIIVATHDDRVLPAVDHVVHMRPEVVVSPQALDHAALAQPEFFVHPGPLNGYNTQAIGNGTVDARATADYERSELRTQP